MVSTGTRHPARQGFAFGISFAVGILLFAAAALSVLQGIAAVNGDALFEVGPDYTYRLDLTTWGWIHIVVGAFLGLVAIGLMSGAKWARMTAICLAALSMVVNFLSLPYYPWWAVLIMALDAVVIWAAATWNPEP
ncbi:hypothetical protein FOH10_23300 [Nocardia otitidiscaviarum]|uniref:DUF7144 domain-containing protein n=1 Tax=Nocardia otitidiscaviarum TaxID=1823 RepID=A0A516NQL7_9NOCA|nr:hypothetical protein [Nocardia otitidiscaviarum]MCP9620427.1 hypothetical protein [Nocardia otitidiscaviarum]QDP81200.1 hypothetical protein FOH10_23300 [Nocardia otitidiscaviarum]